MSSFLWLIFVSLTLAADVVHLAQLKELRFRSNEAVRTQNGDAVDAMHCNANESVTCFHAEKQGAVEALCTNKGYDAERQLYQWDCAIVAGSSMSRVVLNWTRVICDGANNAQDQLVRRDTCRLQYSLAKRKTDAMDSFADAADFIVFAVIVGLPMATLACITLCCVCVVVYESLARLHAAVVGAARGSNPPVTTRRKQPPPNNDDNNKSVVVMPTKHCSSSSSSSGSGGALNSISEETLVRRDELVDMLLCQVRLQVRGAVLGDKDAKRCLQYWAGLPTQFATTGCPMEWFSFDNNNNGSRLTPEGYRFVDQALRCKTPLAPLRLNHELIDSFSLSLVLPVGTLCSPDNGAALALIFAPRAHNKALLFSADSSDKVTTRFETDIEKQHLMTLAPVDPTVLMDAELCQATLCDLSLQWHAERRTLTLHYGAAYHEVAIDDDKIEKRLTQLLGTYTNRFYRLKCQSIMMRLVSSSLDH